MTDISGPAYPQDRGTILPGLTKREYAAIAAMQGFCADMSWEKSHVDLTAARAVQQADALLRELAKEEGK